MSQPPDHRPSYPPFGQPLQPEAGPGSPQEAPPSPFPTAPPPKSRPRWGRRLIILTFIAMLIGSCAVVYVPQEMSGWHLGEAQERRAAGRKDEAYKSLAKAIEWLPDNPKLLIQRAAWRLEDREYEKALADCDEAVALTDDRSTADQYLVLSTRSQILQHLGRHAEAIEDWKTLNRLSQTRGEPPRERTLNGLAYARAVGKLDLPEALKNVAEALEADPGSPAIRDTRGYLLHLQGLNEAALSDLDAAVRGMEAEYELLSKQTPEVRRQSLLSAGIDLSGLNKPEQGVAVVRYHRALVLQALGRHDDAKKDLDRVRELIGREPDEKLF